MKEQKIDFKEMNRDNNQGEIVIYQTDDGDTKIDVRFVDETVWLTQAQLCELYQTSKSNVSEHIKNIFEEGELNENMRLNFTGQPLLYFYFFLLI